MTSLRRVLIVSPHFPPINAPDHQRVRMSLPYFSEFGWQATVLTVDPAYVEGGVVDPLLDATVPQEIDVIRVSALPVRWTRAFGLGNLALRALVHLWRAGNQLLDSRRFDVVYFSTTMFPVTILGPIWKKRFGVPYVVDFQDLWLHDYYERTGTPPPGGKRRHRLSRRLARVLEPKVMRHVSEVISVSPAYVDALVKRYSFLRHQQFTVLPFGAAERDFEMLPSLGARQTVFDRADGKHHWVYVGAAGPIMAVSLRLLFSALRTAREADPKKWHDVRLHFVGTNYAPAGRSAKTVEQIAKECEVVDLVEEQTGRVPYFQALQILIDADAILVIGSDSPSYSPSKIYPCIMARRPMLAVLHELSPAVEIVQLSRAGRVITFNEDNKAEEKTRRAMVEGLNELRRRVKEGIPPETDWQYFKQYGAREMTRRQCEVFDRASA